LTITIDSEMKRRATPTKSNDSEQITVVVDRKLPETVNSVRQGWQLSAQSGAVVSALLTGIAGQLFSYFRDPGSYNRATTSQLGQDTVVVLCYAAIFFNTSATIISFVLIDRLGDLQYQFATFTNTEHGNLESVGEVEVVNSVGLLHMWGGSQHLGTVAMCWIIAFCAGILSLVLMIFVFGMLQESTTMRIILTIILILAFVPCIALILI